MKYATINNKSVLPGGGMRRRKFLAVSAKGAGAIAGVSVFGFPGILRAKQRDFAFQHGVASGDPVADGFVIRTRVTPVPEALPGSGLGEAVVVRWEVATDPEFQHWVARGIAETSFERDHTVKVDVGGLNPATIYFYRFLFNGAASPAGCARTGSAPDATVCDPDSINSSSLALP